MMRITGCPLSVMTISSPVSSIRRKYFNAFGMKAYLDTVWLMRTLSIYPLVIIPRSSLLVRAAPVNPDSASGAGREGDDHGGGLHGHHRSAPDKRERRADQHKRIFPDRGLAMTPAGQDQSLVIMLAVCLPDTFAAQNAAHERRAGIDDERREHDQRKPKRP